jgi:type IV pilus assembly protein PilC
METYRYKGIDGAGRRVCGSIVAGDPDDLAHRLARLDVTCLHHRCVTVRRRPRRRGQRARLIDFTSHLEQLLRAGVPLAEALGDLAMTLEDPDWRDVAAQLLAAIEGGRTFSEALSAVPECFGPVYIALVRIGEDSGRLPPVLGQLNDSLRWHDETAEATRRVLTYPLIVAAVVAAAAVFLMVFLVPELTRFIETMDAALPWYTRALIAVGHGLAQWGWLVAAVAVTGVLALRGAIRTSAAARYYWHGVKLKLWPVGDLILRVSLARLAHGLALMYGAGLSVLEALRLGEALVDNAVLADALARARGRIEEGQTVSDAFAAAGVFPPFVVRMLRVGETTGSLDEALGHVSYFYTRAVRETVARLQPAIQPALTLVLAAVIGWIAVAVFWPIYDTMTALPR